MTFELICAY